MMIIIIRIVVVVVISRSSSPSSSSSSYGCCCYWRCLLFILFVHVGFFRRAEGGWLILSVLVFYSCLRLVECVALVLLEVPNCKELKQSCRPEQFQNPAALSTAGTFGIEVWKCPSHEATTGAGHAKVWQFRWHSTRDVCLSISAPCVAPDLEDRICTFYVLFCPTFPGYLQGHLFWMQLFAYNWKLPAYSGASLLTVGVFYLQLELVPCNWSFLACSGKVLRRRTLRTVSKKALTIHEKASALCSFVSDFHAFSQTI